MKNKNDDKQQFETFKEIAPFEIRDLTREEPYCFNGFISVTKYCITIEKIVEPIEVYRDRLRKLYPLVRSRNQDVVHKEGLKYGINIREEQENEKK